MTKDEKNILLKDLCGRLPYNVKIEANVCPRALFPMDIVAENLPKPYLRPMSSMTNDERLELSSLTDDKFKFYLYTTKPEIICYEKYNYLEGLKVLDWLNAHHFDYRHLIEKGLALEALDGMYNF